MTAILGYEGALLERPTTGWPGEICAASGPFELRPELVAIPTSARDVAALVRWAGSTGRSLTGRGAGTGMPGGNVTRHVLVDLRTHFRRVVALDEAARTITVQPGVTVAEVERTAALHGLTFPVRPSSAERCVVGGVVANNAAGPAALKYGSARQWVEAADVVLADGRPVRLTRESGARDPLAGAVEALGTGGDEWPGVRKNSSGYALDAVARSGRGLDLLVGSEGTLALVTEVTLALTPVAEARATAVVAARDIAELTGWAATARDLGATACEFLGRRLLELAGLAVDAELASLVAGAEALVLVELEGDAATVSAMLNELKAIADSEGSAYRTASSAAEADRLWSLRRRASPAIREAADRGLVSMQFIEDSVVPPGHLGAYVQGVQAILAEQGTDAAIFGHAGDANVHVNPLVDVRASDWRERVRRILDRTVALVAHLGGTLSGEHGDGRVRAPFLARIWGERRARAFAEVKRRLDPQGVLNPGVVVALPGQDPLDGLVPGGIGQDPRERSES